MAPITYTPITTARLDRDKLGAHNFLRDDHYKRLSRSRNGVLRDLTIATANLYSTYDYGHILEIFTDGGRASSSSDQAAQSMAQRISHTGAMVIPYPDYHNNAELGERNWRRMRTDLVQSKYLSPLGKYSPPYRVLGFDHPATIDLYKQQLYKEVVEEDGDKSPARKEQIRQVASAAYKLSQIDALKGSYKNPAIPIVVVEGEFKAQAILDAWMDSVKDLIKTSISTPNPEETLAKLAADGKVPPLFTCAGIGGVWNMVTKDRSSSDKKYVVRPEWSDNISLKDREMRICFDSDSKWLVGVGHAASALAGACQPFNTTIKYITIPSPRGAKLGADDYIQAYGHQPFLKLVEEAQPIAPNIAFTTLQSVMRDGTSPIDYLIQVQEGIAKKKSQVMAKDKEPLPKEAPAIE